MDCVYIKEAKYFRDHVIFLKFNDGKEGMADLKEIVCHYDAATPLRDTVTFSQFYLDSWPTLAWRCGFDIAPETLYEKCKQTSNDEIIQLLGT